MLYLEREKKIKKKIVKKNSCLISIVVPVLNEEENLEKFYQDVKEFSKQPNELEDFELIFVDDGSSDNSLEKIKAICLKDSRVKFISFTKNLGVNKVFTAGLDFFSGKCLIFIDADNQYPISIIGKFINQWINGSKIVYARRLNYSPRLLFKLLSNLFVRFINFTSSINLDQKSSYTCLIDQDIAYILKNMNETTRYYPGLIRWTGFDITYVDCKLNQRKSGVSKIGIRKKIGEAINAITDFTSAPLRIWTILGCTISLCSMCYGIFILGYAMIYGIKVPGYLSIFLTVLFMGGLQLISLGVLSEYVTKIYIEEKKRPSYIVREKSNF